MTRLEGFSSLRKLEMLWVIECEVEQIEGLENCSQLQCLYLYSNKIKVIQNLEGLGKLEVRTSILFPQTSFTLQDMRRG